MRWSEQDAKLAPGVLFGLPAIASYLGVSVRTLRRMMHAHDMPIVRFSFHRYCTTREALDAFMRAVLSHQQSRTEARIDTSDISRIAREVLAQASLAD